MARFYSATTNGFYPESDFPLYEEAGSLPTDLVPVDDELFTACMDAANNDSHVEPDESGYPSVVKDVIEVSQIKAAVDGQISSLLTAATTKIAPLQDAVDLGIATAAETTSLTKWKTYRVAVNRVPTQPGYPTEIDWPSVPE